MTLSAALVTSRGVITLKLFAQQSPITVANFVNLSLRGFYANKIFHRVIPNFMIQGGCPQGSGRGNPGYQFEDEVKNGLEHEVGTLSMANAGPNTNGSQFFITHEATPWLNGKHTVFGRVVEGQSVVDAIAQGDVIKEISFTGDTSAVLKQQSARVAEWNRILDAKQS